MQMGGGWVGGIALRNRLLNISRVKAYVLGFPPCHALFMCDETERLHQAIRDAEVCRIADVELIDNVNLRDMSDPILRQSSG